MGLKANNNNNNDGQRYSKIAKDPRFRRPKKNQTKVKIDSRFSSMMNDSMFDQLHEQDRVDKYGRKKSIVTRKSVDLKKFYQLEGDEEEQKNTKSSSGKEDLKNEISDVSDIDDNEMDFERMAKIARGELILSSSDEEEDEDDSGLKDGIFKVGAAELENVEDKYESDFEDVLQTENVPKGDPTSRFAVVNMDWDNVRAVDLLKVLETFKPIAGVIHNVRIYPSEFGKERMAKEEREGPPPEIFKPTASGEDDDFLKIQNDDGEEFNEEALRKYQLERLRYYYAVVECDSVETAQAIVRECDGTEYERSSVFFDLRFIPDDVDFSSDKFRDEATEVPDQYKPREFVTAVLQYSKPKLTWDEDDPVRLKVTRQKFSKEDLKEMDFQVYLASSDSDSDNDKDALKEKYRALLDTVEEEQMNDNEAVEGDMEITFAPGLSTVASKLLDQKSKSDTQKDETVFETYLRKKKEKRKLRKSLNTQQNDENGLESGGEHSDIENDPFFKDAFDEFNENPEDEKSTSAATVPSENNKKSKKKGGKKQEQVDPELELLMDDDDEAMFGSYEKKKKHFDYDEITKLQTKKKRKKSKEAQLATAEEDTFQVNTADPRFDALYNSSQFAIDPTNSKFRKTEAMRAILDERKKRQRKNTVYVEDIVENEGNSKNKGGDGTDDKVVKAKELKDLVSRLKMRQK